MAAVSGYRGRNPIFSGRPYAIPLARIDQIITVDSSDIADVENRQYFSMNQQNIGLIPAHQVLELLEPLPSLNHFLLL